MLTTRRRHRTRRLPCFGRDEGRCRLLRFEALGHEQLDGLLKSFADIEPGRHHQQLLCMQICSSPNKTWTTLIRFDRWKEVKKLAARVATKRSTSPVERSRATECAVRRLSARQPAAGTEDWGGMRRAPYCFLCVYTMHRSRCWFHPIGQSSFRIERPPSWAASSRQAAVIIKHLIRVDGGMYLCRTQQQQPKAKNFQPKKIKKWQQPSNLTPAHRRRKLAETQRWKQGNGRRTQFPSPTHLKGGSLDADIDRIAHWPTVCEQNKKCGDLSTESFNWPKN